MSQIRQFFLEGESPTLSQHWSYLSYNLRHLCFFMIFTLGSVQLVAF